MYSAPTTGLVFCAAPRPLRATPERGSSGRWGGRLMSPTQTLVPRAASEGGRRSKRARTDYGGAAKSGCWVMAGRSLTKLHEWWIVPPAASLTFVWADGASEVPVSRLARQVGPTLHTIVCDVSARSLREGLFRSVSTGFPAIDVLFDNAGIQRETNFLVGARSS